MPAMTHANYRALLGRGDITAAGRELAGLQWARATSDVGYSRDRIRPGDLCKELYRLGTYLNCRCSEFVDQTQQAKHGFYYSGPKDRVRCFSCAAMKENWMARDDPRLARWHVEGCKLVLGTDTTNKPMFGIPPTFLGNFSSDPIFSSVYPSLPRTQSAPRIAGTSNAALVTNHSSSISPFLEIPGPVFIAEHQRRENIEHFSESNEQSGGDFQLHDTNAPSNVENSLDLTLSLDIGGDYHVQRNSIGMKMQVKQAAKRIGKAVPLRWLNLSYKRQGEGMLNWFLSSGVNAMTRVIQKVSSTCSSILGLIPAAVGVLPFVSRYLPAGNQGNEQIV